jgi:predicted  nucleic acid-binding Zn-ribbon protein
MNEAQRFRKLKAEAAEAREELNRAEGALTQIMEDIKKKYQVGTLEQAEKLLVKLERKATVAQRKFRKALKRFEEKWGD